MNKFFIINVLDNYTKHPWGGDVSEFNTYLLADDYLFGHIHSKVVYNIYV